MPKNSKTEDTSCSSLANTPRRYLYQRNVECSAAEVINNPLAVFQIHVLIFVRVGQAGSDWLLQQHDLFEAGGVTGFFGRVGLQRVERSGNGDDDSFRRFAGV